MVRIYGCCLALLLALLSFATAGAAADAREDQRDIAGMVEKYRQSIVHADDIRRAEQVWLLSPEVSFIHRAGMNAVGRRYRTIFTAKLCATRFRNARFR